MTYQQYPGQAHHPGYAMQPPKPSGATAIIAGVLAVLGGLFSLVGLISVVAGLAEFGFVLWLNVLILVQNVLLTGTLLPGGILLFLRKPVGRVLTIIGSVLAILTELVSVLLDVAGVWDYGFAYFGTYFGGAVVAVATSVIPATATLVLAIVKPTARWLIGYAPR